MTKNELKEIIASLLDDVLFDYYGKHVCINPWSASKYVVGYGDTVKTYSSIEMLMEDELYDGKSLNKIASEISLL